MGNDTLDIGKFAHQAFFQTIHQLMNPINAHLWLKAAMVVDEKSVINLADPYAVNIPDLAVDLGFCAQGLGHLQ